jgi:hypothetical protein
LRELVWWVVRLLAHHFLLLEIFLRMLLLQEDAWVKVKGGASLC